MEPAGGHPTPAVHLLAVKPLRPLPPVFVEVTPTASLKGVWQTEPIPGMSILVTEIENMLNSLSEKYTTHQ